MQLEVLERSVTEQMATELKKRTEALKQGNKTTNREEVTKGDQKQMLAYHLQEIKQLEEEIQLLQLMCCT